MSLTFLGETPSDETKNEWLDAVFFKGVLRRQNGLSKYASAVNISNA